MKDNFYTSAAWRRTRDRVLRRDGYTCVYCKKYGRTTSATTVHHIKHLDEFPELAYCADNLVSVCAACHSAAHPEKGTKARRSVY